MPDTPLEWALHLAADYGFHVFPLSKRGDGKKPPGGLHWREASTADPVEIRRLHDLYKPTAWAVDCEKSGVCVLDADDKNGKSGTTELARLAAAHGGLPGTLKVGTPGPGEHDYYKGLAKSTADALARGVDTRSRGGYVVAPGSILPKGVYKVISNGGIAPAPQWLLDLIGTPTAGKTSQEPVVDQDLDHNIRRAVEYLLRAEPAIEGQGGDARTYATAARLKDLGLSQTTALELMLEHYNPRCAPPWDVDDLGKKVENAFAYALAKAPGEDTIDALFPDEDLDSVPGEAVTAKTLRESNESKVCKPLKLLDISDFSTKPEPRKWLIKDWLPEREAVLLSGDGGTGKSLVALQMALGLGAGVDVFGLPVSRQARVLYLACEDSEEEIHRRVHAALQTADFAFAQPAQGWVHFVSLVGEDALLAVEGEMNKNIIEGGPLYDRLVATIKAMGLAEGEPLVVVLDTAADMLGASENSRSVVNMFVKKCLGGLIRRYGITPIVIGHTAKAAGSEYSGSTAWNNSFRVRLFLQRHESMPGHRVLTRAKSNYSESGEDTKHLIYWDHGAFRHAAWDSEEVVEAAIDQIVFDAIQAAEQSDAPLGLSHQSARPIGEHPITGPSGKKLKKDQKVKSANRLLSVGRIRNETGKKRKNGLFVCFV